MDEAAKRRGIAGDLAVFKVAAAAADAGHDLDEVVRIATMANERTRSLGVAFAGCTLPGAVDPLFTVPERRMVGRSRHPRRARHQRGTDPHRGRARRAARHDPAGRASRRRPAPEGQRVGVILNGLGSVKYEELFVVYRRVAQLLESAGLQIVDPEVGELVTSLDMAGASLTLFWLDDELEPLWTAPADTPAFRKGSVTVDEPATSHAASADEATLTDAEATPAVPWASDTSRRAARLGRRRLGGRA